ncbi:MAG: RNA polymerase sigma factor [Gemmataceae bacterium]
MSPSLAEIGLRDAAMSGNADAWRALYEIAAVDVSRYVRWRCGGRSDWSEDALQETWLTAAKALPRFDPLKGEFKNWVCGLAANVIRNRIRSWKRSLGRNLPLSDEIAANPDHDPEPDRETAMQVMETLARLPERYERALRAKYVEGLSVFEIATRDGETPKAVESLLTRARQAFRDVYPTKNVLENEAS